MNINSKTTKAEMLEYIRQLEAQMAQNDRGEKEVPVIETVTKTEAQAAAPVTPQFVFTAPTNEVEIVYCSEALGHAQISNMEFNFNYYGQSYIITRSQLDELAGKYYRWFQRGVLAVSSKYVDVAAAKNLPTDKELLLSADTLKALGKKSPAEIQKIWEDAKHSEQRESIVYYAKRKFIEGDPAFCNREMVDLLNRLTNGGFNREQDELNGRYKYSVKEF